MRRGNDRRGFRLAAVTLVVGAGVGAGATFAGAPLAAEGSGGTAAQIPRVEVPGTREEAGTPGAAPPPESAYTPPVPGKSRRLSNERTKSRWAYVIRRTWARRAPSRSSRRVKYLRPWVRFTGSPELVLLLRERTLESGARWVKVRLPMRPNNRTGWVPRRALGRYRVVRKQLVLDRRYLKASLYGFKRGRWRKLWTARIGVGIRRWPTPRGRFYVRERFRIPRVRRLRNWYGPFAFGTSAYSPTLSGGNWGEGVIGIHGTGWPWLLPGRVSHGCVRVVNRKILRLRRLMRLGTPIRIK